MKVKIPGSAPAFILAVVAAATLVFPIISLPCSITGFLQAKTAKKFITETGAGRNTYVDVGFYLNLLAIIGTVCIMLISIPASIERNLR